MSVLLALVVGVTIMAAPAPPQTLSPARALPPVAQTPTAIDAQPVDDEIRVRPLERVDQAPVTEREDDLRAGAGANPPGASC